MTTPTTVPPSPPESSPLARAVLALAEELEADGERAYQRSCGPYRDEFSDGQHHAYDLAATRLRELLAAVLAADPEPREAVVERMARAMWAAANPAYVWDAAGLAAQDRTRRLASAALDAAEEES